MRHETIETVLINEGHLIYPIIGRSMYPLLLAGDKVSLTKNNSYQLNDIILFKRPGTENSYILHRIRLIENNQYYILGDNSLGLDIISKENILAKMDGIYKGTEFYSLDSELVSKYNKEYTNNPKISIKSLINDRESLLFSRFDEAVMEVSKLLLDPTFKIDLKKINCLTGEEMDRLILFLRSKKAIHLLGLILDKLNTSISEETKSEITHSLEMAKYRYIKLNMFENEIKDFFKLHGIRFMFLKGSEIRNLYSNPYLRVSNDIDIYINGKDFDNVVRLFAKEFNGKIMPAESKYHESILVDKYKLDVELHFNIRYNLPKDKSHLLDDPFEGATHDLDNEYQLHMNKEKYYLYHILHSAKHTIGGETWLTMLSDTYLLNKDKLTKEFVKSANLSSYEKANYNVSKHLFNHDPVEHNEVSFLKFLYLDNYTRYISLNKGKHKSKIRFIFSRLFVSRSYLISQYPKLKDHLYLLPIYQVRRWFNIFKKNKITESSKEIRSYSSSSDEVYSWLKENGLAEYLK